MSKKVLIIRPTIRRKDSPLNKDAEAICNSIVSSGIVLLPDYYTYEFGEIDGVVWDKQEEKKTGVDWNYLIDYLEDSKGDVSNDPTYNVGYRDGLDVAKRLLLRAKDEVN